MEWAKENLELIEKEIKQFPWQEAKGTTKQLVFMRKLQGVPVNHLIKCLIRHVPPDELNQVIISLTTLGKLEIT